MEPYAREGARDAVEEPREQTARERILSARLPPGDEVEALVELGQEPRNLGGVVLKIAVDRDDDVAACLVEAGDERGRLAEVSAQADDSDVMCSVVQPGERGERSIGRAVVHEDCLPGRADRFERPGELVVEKRDASLLVVHRYHDGDHEREVIRWARHG